MSAPAASAALTGWLGVTARDIAGLAVNVTGDGRRVPSPAEALAAKTVVAQQASQYAVGWFGPDAAEAVRVALVGAAWAATGVTMSALTGVVALGGAAVDLPDLPSWVGHRLRAELGQQPVRRG